MRRDYREPCPKCNKPANPIWDIKEQLDGYAFIDYYECPYCGHIFYEDEIE